MDSLLDPKDMRFDHSPSGPIIGLVRHRQALCGRVDRGPNIFANPLRPDQPALVEEFDVAGCIDLAHEMKAPGRNLQPRGLKVRDQTAQLGHQFWRTAAKPHPTRMLGTTARETSRSDGCVLPRRSS